MLTQPILENLQQLRFYGMLSALEEQMQMPDIDKLGFEERLGLLVDREMTDREDRRLKTRLRKAKLRQHACVVISGLKTSQNHRFKTSHL